MRFYTSFTEILGACMRSEATFKALEAAVDLGEVALLTSAGFNHVLGNTENVPHELTWTGVAGVKSIHVLDSCCNPAALVPITSIPEELQIRWLRFKSMLLKLECRGKLICGVNADHRNWYIHTIISHGHQYMFNLTNGWDGAIAPELEGEPPAEVYINLAHLIELDPKEQAIAERAVTQEVN